MNKIHLFLRFINYKLVENKLRCRAELIQHGYKTSLVIYLDYLSDDCFHVIKSKRKALFTISVKETDSNYVCNWVENTAYSEMIKHFVFNTPKQFKKLK